MNGPVKARHIGTALAAITACALTFGAGLWFGGDRARRHGAWSGERLISTAIDSLRANALDSLPNDELIRRAVNAMLRELHDPYSALLEPDSFDRYRSALQGDGQGLGMTLRRQIGTVTVVRVVQGSPAWSRGVRAGDRVVSVNGVPASEAWTKHDSSSATRDTTLLVVSRAPDDDTVRVQIPKAQWHMPAVADEGLLADSVGYLHLTTISARSADEVEKSVEHLVSRGARSVVLDLRGNAGGIFEEGVKVASLFVPRGSLVASLSGRRDMPLQQFESRHSRFAELPIVVLVDAQTASAAEIIAAAIRDHRRGLLVGSRTYGKGFVQRVVRISPELALRLTTARWLPPSGELLNRRAGRGLDATGGIAPDVYVGESPRYDPFLVPMQADSTFTIVPMRIADSLATLALRERWPAKPLGELTARVRSRIAPLAPSRMTDVERTRWIGSAARMATARVLEVSGEPELLLQLRMNEDRALQAGLEILSPAQSASDSIDSRARVARVTGDNARALQIVDQWVVKRFRGAQLYADSGSAVATSAGAGNVARVQGETDASGDTLVAIHFSSGPSAPLLRASGVARLAVPSGAMTTATTRVIVRRPFRAPRVPHARNDVPSDWRYGWAYVVVPTDKSAGRYAFNGWLLSDQADSLTRGRSRSAASAALRGTR